jgi:hypothetical protein
MEQNGQAGKTKCIFFAYQILSGLKVFKQNNFTKKKDISYNQRKAPSKVFYNEYLEGEAKEGRR